MVKRGEFYAGSQLLKDLVPVIGLPIDQVNFLVCQFIGLLLAYPFRTILSPTKTNTTVRMVVELAAGIALTIFCFGHQIFYLIGQSLVSYLLMWQGNPRWSQVAIFIYCMVYMSVAHIYRQYYDYGGYTLDITGPLMIQTQKLTSLAFSVSDNHRPESELTPDQKSQVVRKVPGLLSFYSYLFYFHGIMCGPLSFYNDYMSFIDGTDVAKLPPSSSDSSSSNGHTEAPRDAPNADLAEKNLQGSVPVFVKKLVTALVCGGLMVTLPPIICPPEGLVEESFFERTILQKTLYLVVCMTLSRQKYYFAWVLGESLNLAAGFGFNGYNSAGQPKWDSLENVSIWDVELANSLKVNIDGWNKRTLVWLRRVVYDRAPVQKTLSVFAVSAFWHGFYPGYYLTFGTAALFTIAARLVRRNIRPWFQTSALKKQAYDAITFFFSRMANVYITFPFLTLELSSCLRIYAAQYFWMHVGAALVIVYFTFFAHGSKRSTDSAKQPIKKD